MHESVLITGRNAEDLTALSGSLQTLSPQVCVKVLDVTQFETVAPVIRQCATELDGLDIIIANAGLGTPLRTGDGEFGRTTCRESLRIISRLPRAGMSIIYGGLTRTPRGDDQTHFTAE